MGMVANSSNASLSTSSLPSLSASLPSLATSRPCTPLLGPDFDKAHRSKAFSATFGSEKLPHTVLSKHSSPGPLTYVASDSHLRRPATVPFDNSTREKMSRLYEGRARERDIQQHRQGNNSTDKYYPVTISKTGTFLWRPKSPTKTDTGFGVSSRGLQPISQSRKNTSGVCHSPQISSPLSSVGSQMLSTRKNASAAGFGMGVRDLWDVHATLVSKHPVRPCPPLMAAVAA